MSSSTLEVGKRLVELCRQGKNVEAVNTLYAPDIVSIEVMSSPQMPARMSGIDAIRKKNQWWIDTHQIHSSDVKGPYPHGDRFIVWLSYDVTAKEGPIANKRMRLEETGLYTVRDGKVAQEEFFYDMSAM